PGRSQDQRVPSRERMRQGLLLNLTRPGKLASEPVTEGRVKRTDQVCFARVLSVARPSEFLIGASLCRGLRLARYHRNLRVPCRGASEGFVGIEEHIRSCGANFSALRRRLPREPLRDAPPSPARIDRLKQHAKPWSIV